VVVEEDITKPENMSSHINNIDQVIVCLGAFPTEGKPFNLYSEAYKGLVGAMVKTDKLRRTQCIFGAGFLGEKVANEFPNDGAPMPIPIIQRDMKIAYD